MTSKTGQNDVRDFCIAAVCISFAGWVFEKLGRYMIFGATGDRGFLSLPVCPIYGISVIAIYLLLGTPKAPGGVVGTRIGATSFGGRIYRSGVWRVTLYFLLVTLISTAAELVTGLFMRSIGITLWDYSERAFNLFGIICPSFSLIWGALITLLMGFAWTPFYSRICAIPKRVAAPLAFTLVTAAAADFAVSLTLAVVRLR